MEQQVDWDVPMEQAQRETKYAHKLPSETKSFEYWINPQCTRRAGQGTNLARNLRTDKTIWIKTQTLRSTSAVDLVSSGMWLQRRDVMWPLSYM